MLKKRLMRVQILLIIGTVLMASCGAGTAEGTETPTQSVNQIQTQAVGTFSSALTLTAMAAPSDTPTATTAPTISPLVTSTAGTPLSATTPGVPVTSGGGATSCYGLTFVRDVSIPDNTQMDPGETFTKTWQVLNSGSCAWDAGFKFQNTGGNAMGAVALVLPSSVASGATFDLAVPMTAPNAAGTVRGNWRMSTATGEFFGDEVFVQIVVGSAAPAATNTTGAPATTQTTTSP